MTTSQFCIIATIVVYLVAMVLVGVYCSRKGGGSSSHEFYLGGRKLGPIVTAMSAEASDMSSYLLMGLPGLAYLCGVAEVGWTAIGLAICTYLNWLIVAKRLRRYSAKIGAITIPGFFSQRFRDRRSVLSCIAAVVILIFFIPYTLSVLVIGYVFKYIFMNPLPELGKALGIKWLSTSLLTNEQLSWIPIVFLAVWQGIAYSVLIYLAGLQTIDDEIYEAAAIDGVNAWQKFWKITFPLIGPFFTINLVLSMKNALGTFDQVVALTEGGPNSSTETVTYLIWKGGLTGGEYAYQTANAVLFFIVLAIIAFVQLRISRSQEQI